MWSKLIFPTRMKSIFNEGIFGSQWQIWVSAAEFEWISKTKSFKTKMIVKFLKICIFNFWLLVLRASQKKVKIETYDFFFRAHKFYKIIMRQCLLNTNCSEWIFAQRLFLWRESETSKIIPRSFQFSTSILSSSAACEREEKNCYAHARWSWGEILTLRMSCESKQTCYSPQTQLEKNQTRKIFHLSCRDTPARSSRK